MDKKQVIDKLKENKLIHQDKIDIFNWYIKNEADGRIATFDTIPNKEFKLSDCKIETANDVQLINYSIFNIRKRLNL